MRTVRCSGRWGVYAGMCLPGGGVCPSACCDMSAGGVSAPVHAGVHPPNHRHLWKHNLSTTTLRTVIKRSIYMMFYGIADSGNPWLWFVYGTDRVVLLDNGPHHDAACDQHLVPCFCQSGKFLLQMVCEYLERRHIFLQSFSLGSENEIINFTSPSLAL